MAPTYDQKLTTVVHERVGDVKLVGMMGPNVLWDLQVDIRHLDEFNFSWIRGWKYNKKDIMVLYGDVVYFLDSEMFPKSGAVDRCKV